MCECRDVVFYVNEKPCTRFDLMKQKLLEKADDCLEKEVDKFYITDYRKPGDPVIYFECRQHLGIMHGLTYREEEDRWEYRNMPRSPQLYDLIQRVQSKGLKPIIPPADTQQQDFFGDQDEV
jgi:hypothetical protein